MLVCKIDNFEGIPVAALVIHTFGNVPEKFHPHVHLIVTDGLFSDTGTFYVMRNVDLKPLKEGFFEPRSLKC